MLKDLVKQRPAVLFTVAAGLVTAAVQGWQYAQATGSTGVAFGLAVAAVAIPAVAGVLIQARVVPLARVNEALDRTNDAISGGENLIVAARELQALTRAAVNRPAGDGGPVR